LRAQRNGDPGIGPPFSYPQADIRYFSLRSPYFLVPSLQLLAFATLPFATFALAFAMTGGHVVGGQGGHAALSVHR
jgi:hypothetical protein